MNTRRFIAVWKRLTHYECSPRIKNYRLRNWPLKIKIVWLFSLSLSPSLPRFLYDCVLYNYDGRQLGMHIKRPAPISDCRFEQLRSNWARFSCPLAKFLIYTHKATCRYCVSITRAGDRLFDNSNCSVLLKTRTHTQGKTLFMRFAQLTARSYWGRVCPESRDVSGRTPPNSHTNRGINS